MTIEHLERRSVSVELDSDTREALIKTGNSHINLALDWETQYNNEYHIGDHPIFQFLKKSFPDNLPESIPEATRSAIQAYTPFGGSPTGDEIGKFRGYTGDPNLVASLLSAIEAELTQDPEIISSTRDLFAKSVDSANKRRHNYAAIEGYNLLEATIILHEKGFNATDLLNQAMQEATTISTKHPDDLMPTVSSSTLYSAIVTVAANRQYFDIARRAIDELIKDFNAPDGASNTLTVAEAYACLGVAEIKAASN